nr:spermidine synthase 1 [Tanacetum cinerariifolium]
MGDSPMKKLKEEETNGAVNGNGNISSVIPGWFSEISPMWP